MSLTFIDEKSHFLNGDDAVISNAFKKLKEESDSGEIGYYTLPKSSISIIEDLKNYVATNSIVQNAKQIVVIGIGGSSLGSKAVDTMLRHKNNSNKELLFFENSDPINITTTLNKIKKSEAVFILISKSGSTIETTSIYKTILEHLDFNLQSDDSKRIIVITDKGSSLSLYANEYNLKEFNLPLNVGGRFSVLSAVGIVPLYLAGYDVKSLLEGAGEFVESFFDREAEHLLNKAYYLYKNSQTLSINVLFAYSNSLEDFTKWYVQLWGESLGKIDNKGQRVGLTPIGITGSVDQHSFLQLIIEGPKDKTVTFISVKDFENNLSIPDVTLKHIEKTNFINNHTFSTLINAQCDATKQSLEEVGVTTDKIEIEKLNEKNTGALIIYYEILTSLVGAMFQINTYNQPGVELGKVILDKKFKG